MEQIALLLVVLIIAPLAMVLLFAILRGYTVDMKLHRPRRHTDNDNDN